MMNMLSSTLSERFILMNEAFAVRIPFDENFN
jgi:hypothetical protein